jgi:hypothetical protein
VLLHNPDLRAQRYILFGITKKCRDFFLSFFARVAQLGGALIDGKIDNAKFDPCQPFLYGLISMIVT